MLLFTDPGRKKWKDFLRLSKINCFIIQTKDLSKVPKQYLKEFFFKTTVFSLHQLIPLVTLCIKVLK